MKNIISTLIFLFIINSAIAKGHGHGGHGGHGHSGHGHCSHGHSGHTTCHSHHGGGCSHYHSSSSHHVYHHHSGGGGGARMQPYAYFKPIETTKMWRGKEYTVNNFVANPNQANYYITVPRYLHKIAHLHYGATKTVFLISPDTISIHPNNLVEFRYIDTVYKYSRVLFEGNRTYFDTKHTATIKIGATVFMQRKESKDLEFICKLVLSPKRRLVKYLNSLTGLHQRPRDFKTGLEVIKQIDTHLTS